jgi:hypothetical protein
VIPAAELPAPPPESADAIAPSTPDADFWRRTTRGWERMDFWPRRPSSHRVRAIHPLNIAGLQFLLSLGALLACEPHLRQRHLRQRCRAGQIR